MQSDQKWWWKFYVNQKYKKIPKRKRWRWKRKKQYLNRIKKTLWVNSIALFVQKKHKNICSSPVPKNFYPEIQLAMQQIDDSNRKKNNHKNSFFLQRLLKTQLQSTHCTQTILMFMWLLLPNQTQVCHHYWQFKAHLQHSHTEILISLITFNYSK